MPDDNLFRLTRQPPTEKDKEHARKRLERLSVTERTIDGATASLKGSARWHDVRIRARFVHQTKAAPDDASDRRLPARHHRPPATRLLSASGIALRFYLIALCEAQLRTRAGETPTNRMPLLVGGTETGWTDLVALPVEAQGKLTTRSSPSSKKHRSVIKALQTLADPEVQLVHLPHEQAETGKYEQFQLFDEGGARQTGEVPLYTVPRRDPREEVFGLPSGLFSNGWIHLLKNSELAFLMMIARAVAGSDSAVMISGDDRLLHYGLGRDSYEAHLMLERFGIVDVQIAANRYEDMRVANYGKKGGEALLHIFKLNPDAFGEPAATTIKRELNKYQAEN